MLVTASKAPGYAQVMVAWPIIGREHTKQALPEKQRLLRSAELCRREANALPPGREREMLLRKARQAETAAHLDDWLSSPGLASPN
jgi:hypothetical protein